MTGKNMEYEGFYVALLTLSSKVQTSVKSADRKQGSWHRLSLYG
jgi:hypothetical protein